MIEFLQNLYTQLKEIYTKLDTTKRIIIGVVAGVLVVSFIVLFSVSTEKANVVLFSDLPAEEFGKVTKQLEEMGYSYTTDGTTTVLVDPGKREVIMTRLAQED
ncbi:MAG TPA: flagellar M-ring protein FliF, partial [Spirochaetota bacterium]|nr:flagellar M-ring protein FliF [Spirochaetota bacterium]